MLPTLTWLFRAPLALHLASDSAGLGGRQRTLSLQEVEKKPLLGLGHSSVGEPLADGHRPSPSSAHINKEGMLIAASSAL